MTHKYTIELDNAADTVQRLNSWRDPVALTLVAQLLAQLPKPVPEEPTGDVLVDVDGELLRPRPPHWIPCVGYTNNPPTWAELVDGLEPGQIKIYDARPLATPPTEEVAAADELMVGTGFSPKPDPLEALYAELKDEWELDAGDWVILRNFVERVRALTTEDTVPADKVREALASFEEAALSWRRDPASPVTPDRVWDTAATTLRLLLPKAGQ